MSEEQTIQDQLVGKFPFLKDKVSIARPRRLFAEVQPVNLPEVFDWAVRQMDFSILCTITGSDRGEALEAMYHLARKTGAVLTLIVSIPKSAPVLQSITSYFPAADAYERELVDLLGMEVLGLPPGSRYPLPDGWPKGVFPLRKDCDLTVLDKGGPQ
jgi:Ni,Fe-hydrogenase III component G